MVNVILSPAALQDIEDIWVYIARDNKTAADAVHEQIEKTFNAIAAMPHSGTLYPSHRLKEIKIRVIPVYDYPKYLVYYVVGKETLRVIRVLHGYRDRSRLL